ncbi:MAG: NAD(P)H-hydrate epimerase [Phycisphaerae bacterium]|nr:NAD(P)H-hydrate epimerase [Phycisphaerae bacterium]
MFAPKPMTRQEVREVDRAAIEDYGIPGVVLMENAGRGAARVILTRLGDLTAERVAIVCGAGNNGGDGFVIARHLHNAGVQVTIYLAVDTERLKGDALINHDIVRKMSLPTTPLRTAEQIARATGDMRSCRVVVDALLGTGFTGDVRAPFDAIIRSINELDGPDVVAVDVPSGLDCDTGRTTNATVRADVTVTFVAPKVGMLVPEASGYVGEIVVVDIGAPRELVPADQVE